MHDNAPEAMESVPVKFIQAAIAGMAWDDMMTGTKTIWSKEWNKFPTPIQPPELFPVPSKELWPKFGQSLEFEDKIKNVLVNAKALLEKNKWIQYRAYEYKQLDTAPLEYAITGYCLEGAIKGGAFVFSVAARAALQRIQDILGGIPPHEYNDRPYCSKELILNVLDKAIAIS